MEAIKPKLNYSVCKKEKGGIPVIIAAAGSSSRMKGADKQFIRIGGIPVIARTLLAFERSPDISKIILVTREQSVNDMQLIAEKYMISKLTDIVVGSDTRQKSVICGLEKLQNNEDKVLISDGARMFVTKKQISDCVKALENHDGCVTAVKVNDTVKKVENGVVISTVDRTPLYLAQTPQGITVSLYRKALENVDITALTDDASVMEAGGFDVAVVEGDRKNIKITTTEDIALAEIVLKEMSVCE